MQDIPSQWPMIVKLLEDYTLIISSQVERWKFQERGQYKCNLDGASTGNPGPSACTFFIQNSKGELIFIEIRKINDGFGLKGEMTFIKLGLDYCIDQNLLLVYWK